jgi:hypothetical protein
MGGKTNGKAGDTEDEVRSTHAPPSVCSDWSDWSDWSVPPGGIGEVTTEAPPLFSPTFVQLRGTVADAIECEWAGRGRVAAEEARRALVAAQRLVWISAEH